MHQTARALIVPCKQLCKCWRYIESNIRALVLLSKGQSLGRPLSAWKKNHFDLTLSGVLGSRSPIWDCCPEIKTELFGWNEQCFFVFTFDAFSRTLADWSFGKSAAVISSVAMKKIAPNSAKWVMTATFIVVCLWFIERERKQQSPIGRKKGWSRIEFKRTRCFSSFPFYL